MCKQLALLLTLLAISLGHAAAAASVRMKVMHVDAGRGLTNRELLQRLSSRSKARAARLLSKAASAPVTPGAIPGAVPDTEYLAHLAIGTPPQPVQLTLDTGSDLVWTQCRPCNSCFRQDLPYFDPSLSSTFAGVPCRSTACQSLRKPSCVRSPRGQQACAYSYSYADGSVTIGRIEADTVTFDGHTATAVTGVSFGCGHDNTGIFKSNETGIVGFGRGFLSLPSQLKVGNFSHCFTTITGAAAPSAVLLGLPANLYNSARGVVQTTPLVRNPPRNPNFYYVSLRGITVGSTRLPVPESAFTLRDDGDGGTIIDSGTGMTSLPEDVYKLMREAFVAQVRLRVYNVRSLSQLCFAAPSSSTAKPDDVPKLLFHFEGATLDLPRENYMFDAVEEGRSITCLAINAGGGSMTIVGNYQQQNMHVLYDLANGKLSFVPAQCEKL
ncbi:hypothetical protein SEVIR_8G253100v4 [Setaria viridis]|uniref:Peptidase A1 domain-containing protein n=1 Tax=Setaria viridis TaxID=4556 RepID=A0A4U6TXV9_SETVI|nr:aspartic proteinase nepenthesin-1-like [Setaria viridis]TKW02637.1 hypothetical protein SEVIR_8G253100v2 [Setaria viridis]